MQRYQLIKQAIVERTPGALAKHVYPLAVDMKAITGNLVQAAILELDPQDIRKVLSWAEDWLSEPQNCKKRLTDPIWLSMHLVYTQSRAILIEFGDRKVAP